MLVTSIANVLLLEISTHPIFIGELYLALLLKLLKNSSLTHTMIAYFVNMLTKKKRFGGLSERQY